MTTAARICPMNGFIISKSFGTTGIMIGMMAAVANNARKLPMTVNFTAS